MPAHIHLVGIGGINMSAIAKLLWRSGIKVTGSDAVASEQTEELTRKGIPVTIGQEVSHLPTEASLLIYSSAVPEGNPERSEARARNLRQLTNFEFLAEWAQDQDVVLVTGTHGKSTTTAIAGLMLVEAQFDPLIIVGSKVPSFSDGNVRSGAGNIWLIEGDEYARHFLAFHPKAVLINNIELDHTDIFPTLDHMIGAFRELLHQVRDGGVVVANADDRNVSTLIGSERAALEARGIRIMTYGYGAHAMIRVSDEAIRPGEQQFLLKDEAGHLIRAMLRVPGKMNICNAVGAAALSLALGASPDAVRKAVQSFTGIWRRFEQISDKDGVLVISDYGHHPTAIRATLEAARSFYPGRRIVLCFQPHQHNRTRELFLDFVPAFDLADVLILVEIYDVPGRKTAQDEHISSQDLHDAIRHHDADRLCQRSLEFAPTPEDALPMIERAKRRGDIVIVMGAGDVYKIADRV